MIVRTVIFCWLLLSQSANGIVQIFLDTAHDDLAVRTACLMQPEIARRGELISKLERKVIDRLMTRRRLESRFKPAQPVPVDDLVRPIGADDMLSLEGLQRDDIEGLAERAAYFEMKNGLGGVYVFFGADGKPFPRCAIYWTVDDQLPSLNSVDACEARWQWEQHRLESLMKLIGVTEEQLSVSLDDYPWIPDR